MIARVATEIRQQVAPRIAAHEAIPLACARGILDIEGLHGRYRVRGRPMDAMPDHIWGLTCFRGPRAFLWFHRVAWDELALEIERSRWTAGHELGHVALHARFLAGDDQESSDMEAEANIFCAHLIAPDAGLRHLWTPTGSPTASDIASRFRISVVAAARRLHEFVATA